MDDAVEAMFEEDCRWEGGRERRESEREKGEKRERKKAGRWPDNQMGDLLYWLRR